MEIIADVMRRGAIVALWVRVFLLVLLGLPVGEKVHTAPVARPWGFEARHIRRYGRRVVAVRVQLLAVTL